MNKLFIVVFVVAIGASYGLFLDNVSSFLLGCIFSILVPFKRILLLNILLQWIIPQLTKILNSTSLDKNFITA
jgi:hypothetical protein